MDGLDRLIPALTSRAAARAYIYVSVLDLPKGYVFSFGALLPLAMFAFFRLLFALPVRDGGFWIVLFVASFPIIENAIMMQHAVRFPFDRLKLAVPLLLVCAMALATLRPQLRRGWMVLVLMVALIGSDLRVFYEISSRFAPWGEVHAANTRLLDAFEQDAQASCPILGTNWLVRGYLNLNFQADIHEQTDPMSVLENVTPAEDCAIFIHTDRSGFTDLQKLLAIEVYDAQGAVLRRYDAR